MKYLLIIFLVSNGFSFEIPNFTVPGLVKKIYRAGKVISEEGSKPPPIVQKQFDDKWGDKLQKPKQEWKRISTKPDTVIKNDTVYVKDTVSQLLKQNMFTILEDDMLINFDMDTDSLINIMLWE